MLNESIKDISPTRKTPPRRSPEKSRRQCRETNENLSLLSVVIEKMLKELEKVIKDQKFNKKF